MRYALVVLPVFGNENRRRVVEVHSFRFFLSFPDAAHLGNAREFPGTMRAILASGDRFSGHLAVHSVQDFLKAVEDSLYYGRV